MTTDTRSDDLQAFGRQALDIFDQSDIPEVGELAKSLRADAAHRGPIVWHELAEQVVAVGKAGRS